MKFLRLLTLISGFFTLCSAQPAERVTANYYYPRADSIARAVLAEPFDFLIARSNKVDTIGTSDYWEYIFQKTGQHIRIYISTDSISYTTTGGNWTGTSVIDHGWFDSDSALAIAERNGGREFRKKFPKYTILADLGEDSGLGRTEWSIIYTSSVFADVQLTLFINAITGKIRLKWNPKLVSYFPLAAGNTWSYYSTETGTGKEPIQFNSVADSLIIQGRTYFNYTTNDFSSADLYRSDSMGHVYRYVDDQEILWFDFTKAEGESYYVDLGGDHFQVTMTSRRAAVTNWAGQFENGLRLSFDAPDCFDEEFAYVFARDIGIVEQKLAHAITLELYDANISGKRYPNLRNYFPLSIGNYWVYSEVGISHPDLPVKVLDTCNINGDMYYYYGSAKNSSELIFADSLGKVWQYKNNKKIVWFDFTMADGDSYSYIPDSTNLNYVVKVLKHKTIATKLGVLAECVTFVFDDPNAVDDEYSYTFAPDVGIIETWNGMGIHHVLNSAFINGKKVTPVLSNSHARPAKFALKQNYPNPFNPNTTILYELPTPGLVEFNLYNVLGQGVQSFKTYQLPGVHRIELSASGLGSGVYIYEIKSGCFAERKKLVVQK